LCRVLQGPWQAPDCIAMEIFGCKNEPHQVRDPGTCHPPTT